MIVSILFGFAENIFAAYTAEKTGHNSTIIKTAYTKQEAVVQQH
ncbi:hypothetical protein CLOHYLEM_06110 [[Clostridium] hylemonae DSM 15053]|uniref:Uncharacterized protein n=1 Tax=[Clostridium] hylemonae DSM 15053 TaxID=553973 RepID=C0C1U0_9FIRM|nr:hypothetical protein CLOHYLEM_06110 [[Clostridium] hylemonae DSM 15053]